MSSFKLLSYNIHKGFSLKNQYVLKEIKEAISLTKADLVCLQEVVGKNSKHKITTPQFEYLADTSWPHYAYGKNAIQEKTDHGNAILSEYPIEEWANIDVSSSSLEKRGLLYAKIRVPSLDKVIHVVNVHLSLLEKDRKKQFQAIKKLIVRCGKDPVIVAGDFNDWTLNLNGLMDKEGFKEAFVEITGDNPKTFPSAMPFLKLDRVYYKNIKATSALALSGKPWSNLSDHLALLVEFSL